MSIEKTERFLRKFFDKLKEEDFQADKILESFYLGYDKSKKDAIRQERECVLFDYYTEFLIRNKEFATDADRSAELSNYYTQIKNHILHEEQEDTKLGFVSQQERKDSDQRHHSKSAKSVKSKAAPIVDKGAPVKIVKSKALRVLSNFLQESGIAVNEEPDQELTQNDQDFRESTADNIVIEITADGRKLPDAVPDVVFGQRSDMMNIWHDTEDKCNRLTEEKKLRDLFYKVYFINSLQQLASKADKITTCEIVQKFKNAEGKTVTEILVEEESFVPCYSNIAYNTQIRLVNKHPLDEVIARQQQKIRTLYICAGSRMVLGGNADQGLDVVESMPYLTSTYSITIQRILHAYTLYPGQIILCPNILVFKDTKYQDLPPKKWQKIAICNVPSKWRPKLKYNGAPATDPDLYDVKTMFLDEPVKNSDTQDQVITPMKSSVETRKIISSALEAALFYGYDTVVLDDRGIEDNGLPAHQTAKIMKEECVKFSGRFKEIIVAISKSKSFNVFKYHFDV